MIKRPRDPIRSARTGARVTIAAAVLAWGALFLLAGCGDGDGELEDYPDPAVDTPQVTLPDSFPDPDSFVVYPETLEVVKGDTALLTGVVYVGDSVVHCEGACDTVPGWHPPVSVELVTMTPHVANLRVSWERDLAFQVRVIDRRGGGSWPGSPFPPDTFGKPPVTVSVPRMESGARWKVCASEVCTWSEEVPPSSGG